jgi:hypothetical protein
MAKQPNRIARQGGHSLYGSQHTSRTSSSTTPRTPLTHLSSIHRGNGYLEEYPEKIKRRRRAAKKEEKGCQEGEAGLPIN